VLDKVVCGSAADGARAGVGRQVGALERWNPGQHVVTESLSGAIVTQTIICHGPSHPKLPQPSPGKHTGVAEFVFSGAPRCQRLLRTCLTKMASVSRQTPPLLTLGA
jgi:hypothetical protein